MMIWNNQGLVLASLLQQLPQAYGPLEVEALAIAKALQFSSEIGITNIVIWGDSLVLIQPLRSGNESLTPYGLLLEDVWVCSNSFTQFRYFYVKRESNKVTHSRARFAINVLDFLMWIKDVPPQFLSVLQLI